MIKDFPRVQNIDFINRRAKRVNGVERNILAIILEMRSHQRAGIEKNDMANSFS